MKYTMSNDGKMRATVRLHLRLTQEEWKGYTGLARELGFAGLRAFLDEQAQAVLLGNLRYRYEHGLTEEADAETAAEAETPYGEDDADPLDPAALQRRIVFLTQSNTVLSAMLEAERKKLAALLSVNEPRSES